MKVRYDDVPGHPHRDDETKIVLRPISRQAETSRNTVTVHLHRG
jgi:hypothetical protein